MTVPERHRVGFLGLGTMGWRMAANLARAGCSVTAWTNTSSKARAWAAEHGANAADTPAEVAAASEIVISMVVDGPQVERVLTGPGGAADGAGEGLLCVDMTTISLAASTSKRWRPSPRAAQAARPRWT
jgi:3-hydroxyisobutyrate dehydrogenase-like beta-hydroxyacid dehydrogenase